MKHLYSHSVFQSPTDVPGDGNTPMERLSSIGCDGLELFTLFQEVPVEYKSVCPSVHLPYAIDWHRAWTNSLTEEEASVKDLEYTYFGRNREEVIENVYKGIDYASAIDPAYGVLHAGNTNMDTCMMRLRFDRGTKVLEDFIEMINSVAARFPGGEPPFKLAFENLWWDGLRLMENSEYTLMADKLEFDNWGYCLDTGHLMNTQAGSDTEEHAIEALLKVFDGYSKDMKDRIGTMHFHMSLSAEYRATFPEHPRGENNTLDDMMALARPHVNNIDQHKPFTNPRCKELLDVIQPDFVTHEMMSRNGSDPIADFKQQRAFL